MVHCWAAGIAPAHQIPISFHHLETVDGLSNHSVRTIAQDSKGFVWMGTDEGLNRYDGISFHVYKNSPDDPHSLSSNRTFDLIFDRQGYAWVATDYGLNRWDPQSDQFTHFFFDSIYPDKPGINFILNVFEDSQGLIWIGTVNGLHRYSYETQSFESFFHDPNDTTTLSLSLINDVLEDHEGTIWIATHSKGMNRLKKGETTFTRIMPEQDDPTPSIPWTPTCLFEDKDHQFWVGTWDKGLLRFDPDTLAFTPVPEIINCNVRFIKQDRSGSLWVGTIGNGLYVQTPDRKSFTQYLHDPSVKTSLSSNRIYSFLQDQNDLFWVGTLNGSVNTFRDPQTQIQHYQPGLISKTSLSDKSVMSITEDAQGIVWIGTQEKGLERFDPDTGLYKNYIYATEENKPHLDVVVTNYIYSIQPRSDGQLLLGTLGYGLVLFNPTTETFTFFNQPENLPYFGYFRTAKDITVDSQDRYWLCNDDGHVICVDQSIRIQQVHGTGAEKFSFPRLSALTFQDDRSLWVGTEAEGLNRLDTQTGKITVFTHQPQNPASISNNTIWDIVKDSQGRVWVGTNDGLNQFDPATDSFQRILAIDSFPSQAILSILEDSSGNLWLSTNRGLIRFNPLTNAANWYGLHNGIQGYEFAPKSRFAGSSGNLYFGGMYGFNIIDTNTFRDYPCNAPLVLSQIQVDGAPYQTNRMVWDLDEIVLPFKKNNLEFLFSLLDYTAPDLNILEYRIGETGAWQKMNQTQKILFADLSPGVRQLHIRGTNADGSRSPHEKEFSITILPPFWMTWWFWTLLALAFIGSIVAYFTLRMRRIQQEKKNLEELVAHRTAVLAAERDYFHSTIQASPLMIFGFTPDGILTFLNPTAEIMLQIDSRSLVGQPWWNISSIADERRTLQSIHQTIQTQCIFDLELCLTFLPGTPRTMMWNFIQRISATGVLKDILAFGNDITERKKMEEQLFRLSIEDGLTHIANRRWFDAQFQKAWLQAASTQTPISLCMIDIDFFKRYNDLYGHLKGDDCLRQVAGNLQSQLHRPSDLVARFGGEEFVIMLPNTFPFEGQQIAERFRSHIESLQIPHEDSPIASSVTISVGIATLIPKADIRTDTLLAMADQALYEAKKKGRNQVISCSAS
ncbi:MAG: diguanylate cyclase [bacterium]|nr:diguanylate cyclase [bacterium]